MACITCNGTEKYKDLEHVKIIAQTFANQQKCDVGLWFDGVLYSFEPVGFTGRKYLFEIQYNRNVTYIEISESNRNEGLQVPVQKKGKKKSNTL